MSLTAELQLGDLRTCLLEDKASQRICVSSFGCGIVMELLFNGYFDTATCLLKWLPDIATRYSLMEEFIHLQDRNKSSTLRSQEVELYTFHTCQMPKAQRAGPWGMNHYPLGEKRTLKVKAVNSKDSLKVRFSSTHCND